MMIDIKDSLGGWSLVLISSLSCITGAGIVFMNEKVLENKKFLSGSMALGAGVLFCNAQFLLLPASYQKLNSLWAVALCFLMGLFGTVCLSQFLQKFTPDALHACDSLPTTKTYGTVQTNMSTSDEDQKSYYLIGIQTAVAICIHKFPEGLIMFISNESSPQLGLSVASAMVIHNLMEGFLIALPFYYATNSQFAAFSFASVLGGLSQPLGALIGLVTIQSVDKKSEEVMFGAIFGMMSGMMNVILTKPIASSNQMESK
ncbi:hypothetical protein G6F46_005295 [Rhizopus delemar]|uniref:Zinc/iron permease n=2 Tax=Rhizopus TaxID=4842 RepID=A0A9P6Z373_9FUNG|nr:hypothetical protein G6F43_007263 [Rhizopus delemar]KAG1543538.1 hypothetical protein G6F51_006607 [Rhizopus arrhizus]KAG1455439.1 hypothetical protein G6F55_007072 [Rhizopus delemar]KAG1511131.1 hypothetical protein G6F53_006163 [Rhizopus delemar]KAG1520107.1 hypothetical protein G6F52_007977 [Rhizopus delemar]